MGIRKFDVEISKYPDPASYDENRVMIVIYNPKYYKYRLYSKLSNYRYALTKWFTVKELPNIVSFHKMQRYRITFEDVIIRHDKLKKLVNL